MRAHRVLQLAAPETVRWRALSADCDTASAETPARGHVVVWQRKRHCRGSSATLRVRGMRRGGR